MKSKTNSRNNNTLTVKDAFELLLDEYKIRAKYSEGYIISEWEKIVGKTISSKTNKVFIKDKKLYLQTNSASLKHHLSINKSQLISLINDKAGIIIIDELVLF